MNSLNDSATWWVYNNYTCPMNLASQKGTSLYSEGSIVRRFLLSKGSMVRRFDSPTVWWSSVSHVRPNVRLCGHEIFSCPYFLVLIFNVTTISCLMLRPLSCLTMFCDHNLSLVCRFNLQFSHNYINIDTDEIQHWFCYFVQSLWDKNTIYERSNGRTFYHIFIPYTNTFFSLFHIVLYTIM